MPQVTGELQPSGEVNRSELGYFSTYRSYGDAYKLRKLVLSRSRARASGATSVSVITHTSRLCARQACPSTHLESAVEI